MLTIVLLLLFHLVTYNLCSRNNELNLAATSVVESITFSIKISGGFLHQTAKSYPKTVFPAFPWKSWETSSMFSMLPRLISLIQFFFLHFYRGWKSTLAVVLSHSTPHWIQYCRFIKINKQPLKTRNEALFFYLLHRCVNWTNNDIRMILLLRWFSVIE